MTMKPEDLSAPQAAVAKHRSVTMDTPIGPVTIRSDGQAIIAVSFGRDASNSEAPPQGGGRLPAAADGADDPILARAVRQLNEYFEGTRSNFDLPLGARGTAWQTAVWKALREIPFGTTASYGDVARRAGSPNAARAVGAANHVNPLGIVVPCHRVVGRDGSLTGYAGGLPIKEWLLRHEERMRGAAH
jgi:methylated-DNA-[protein]-cysteine S-methyltransferase